MARSWLCLASSASLHLMNGTTWLYTYAYVSEAPCPLTQSCLTRLKEKGCPNSWTDPDPSSRDQCVLKGRLVNSFELTHPPSRGLSSGQM